LLPAFASGSKSLRPGERDLAGAKYFSCMASKVASIEHILLTAKSGPGGSHNEKCCLLVQQAAIYAIRTQPAK